jgi:hypothetical protein
MTEHRNEPARRRLNMSCRGPRGAIGFTLLFLGTTTIISLAATETPDSSSGARIVPQEDEQLTQYRALRRMHAVSERFNQEGWLEAWTEFSDRGFRYEIVSECGSDYVRNKVLRPILKREQELVADGPDRGALTEDNYVFIEQDEPGGARYVLMKPKRKDVLLVDGRMVLSADGSEILRIEGRLSKNPSFWTSLVNVIRRFAKVDGVRVPVSTESTANVKFAGQSRLDVSYDYESINGRRVSTAARQVLASAAPAGR